MKRLAAITALAVLCLTLSGCRFFTVDTEELMFPPKYLAICIRYQRRFQKA